MQTSRNASGWTDVAAVAVCTLAWGTTWFAITLQFGAVDPVVSIAYRFGLAAALCFLLAAKMDERLAFTLRQHRAAAGLGLFTFGINYPLVYWAEERVTSAAVAVAFAGFAFVNLIGFRIAFRQRAPLLAWTAAAMGVAGVILLSYEEIASAQMNREAALGMAMAALAVVGSAVGNIFAKRGEAAGAGLVAMTAWAMAYGTGLLAVFAAATGREWRFEWTWSYVGSLLYLSILGSVVAFVLYYRVARRRGYAVASYVAAMTPPIAMLTSSLFEDKDWGALALFGVAVIILGQILLLRAKNAEAKPETPAPAKI